jgi:hypothetical protein
LCPIRCSPIYWLKAWSKPDGSPRADRAYRVNWSYRIWDFSEKTKYLQTWAFDDDDLQEQVISIVNTATANDTGLGDGIATLAKTHGYPITSDEVYEHADFLGQDGTLTDFELEMISGDGAYSRGGCWYQPPSLKSSLIRTDFPTENLPENFLQVFISKPESVDNKCPNQFLS